MDANDLLVMRTWSEAANEDRFSLEIGISVLHSAFLYNCFPREKEINIISFDIKNMSDFQRVSSGGPIYLKSFNNYWVPTGLKYRENYQLFKNWL